MAQEAWPALDFGEEILARLDDAGLCLWRVWGLRVGLWGVVVLVVFVVFVGALHVGLWGLCSA